MEDIGRLDIYNSQSRYDNWKKLASAKAYVEEGLTPRNSKLLVQYIFDMELGQNVAKNSKKGARSPKTLIVLKQKISQIFRMFEARGVKDISRLNAKKVMELFRDLDNGTIKTKEGKPFKSSKEYAKRFTSFWNWWRRMNRRLYFESNKKKGKENIPDLTLDIDTSEREKNFVWLTKEQFDKFRKYFEKEDQVLLFFVFDSIVRSPTEVRNIKVGDLFERDNELWLNVRDEISKTYGTSFNLVYTSKLIRDYIKKKELKPTDFLFKFNPATFHKKMQDVALQLFGEEKSPAGEYYKNITLYDLRHSGAIHFRQLFQKTGQSLDSLRERGRWKDFRMINYYTKLLGLDGHIHREKLLLPEQKAKLEENQEQIIKDIETIKNRFPELFN